MYSDEKLKEIEESLNENIEQLDIKQTKNIKKHNETCRKNRRKRKSK
jgi:hypothetical protein